MKNFLLTLTALSIWHLAIAKTPTTSDMKNEITDSFKDIIKKIDETDTEIVVEFNRHAALYKMQKNNPRYEELKNKFLKLKKEDKKVKVVAVIPSMEIKDITE